MKHILNVKNKHLTTKNVLLLQAFHSVQPSSGDFTIPDHKFTFAADFMNKHLLIKCYVQQIYGIKY